MKGRALAGVVILVVTMLLLVQACGGSSAPAVSEPTPSDVAGGDNAQADDANNDNQEDDDGLPNIIDDYDDNLFKYADRSIYEDDEAVVGKYALITDPAENCSAMLGIQMPNTVDVLEVFDTQARVVIDGVEYNYPAVSQSAIGEYDMWSYYDIYDADYECALTFCSGVTGFSPFETWDFFAFGCYELATDDICISGYQRVSEYDFSSTVVKSAGGERGDAVESMYGAMESILDVDAE